MIRGVPRGIRAPNAPPEAQISMPVTGQFYGMKEFAFEDPDGYTIAVAQKAE
jgi:uncharacterized glyoxalase superfamily protein PhnB